MPKKQIPLFDLNAFSERFRAESDRACAVLGAAMVDSRLESLYVRRLRYFKDDLLSERGPIGTFYSRIELAHALAWINTDVHHDLDKIRKVRNEFAHSFDHNLSFANPSITDLCNNLHTAQTILDAYEIAASKPHKNFSAEIIRAMGSIFRPPRARYEITVELISQHLDEIAGEIEDYKGPDFLTEVRQLGSEINITIRATGRIDSESADQASGNLGK
jgi:hypothetical protein